MEIINSEMNFFNALMKMLKNQFGSNCEIILHDWSRGYDKSIAAIENGYITGRKIGDCGSNLGLEIIRGTVDDGDRYNYITQTRDGKTLKSSTMFIKNDEGKVLGALCINTDISDLIVAQKTIDKMVPQELSTERTTEEFFASDVNDLLSYLINESLKITGKPVNQMLKEDKIVTLDYLDKKGALLISKAGTKICQVLDISKFTLYNYLDEIRGRKL